MDFSAAVRCPICSLRPLISPKSLLIASIKPEILLSASALRSCSKSLKLLKDRASVSAAVTNAILLDALSGVADKV